VIKENNNHSDDEDDELKQEFVEDDEEHQPKKKKEVPKEAPVAQGPSVTITGLNLVRYIGYYLQMMKILRPIAYEVFQGVVQLFEYYLFSVFYLFSKKPNSVNPPPQGASASLNYLFQRAVASPESDAVTPEQFLEGKIQFIILFRTRKIFTLIFIFVAIAESKLKEEFTRIYNSLLSPEQTPKLQIPTLSPGVDIHSSNSMFGISERTVAFESLSFVAECMNCVKPHVLQILPANHTEVNLHLISSFEIFIF
jgi:hypothetical protein